MEKKEIRKKEIMKRNKDRQQTDRRQINNYRTVIQSIEIMAVFIVIVWD